MPGTILENLSNYKLCILVAVLLSLQSMSFMVGFMTPTPANSQSIWATYCLDDPSWKTTPPAERKWLTRDCDKPLQDLRKTDGLDAENIVITFEMPPRRLDDFSRWQQNLVGILEIDVIYHEGEKILDHVLDLTIDASLAYSNKNPNTGGRSDWTYYAHSEEKRIMDCSFNEDIKDKNGYPYNCSMVPLFELGSLFHDYYLLNIRLPTNVTLNQNVDLPRTEDFHLHIIYMNGGYTQIWASLKTVYFPIILLIMIWFWNRVHMLSRTPALLEYMLMSLGGTLLILDLPIEFLTLYFNMPYFLVLSDIRQGVFYAMLLSFWLVFAGEHMLIQDNGEKNSLRIYWKHLSTIAIGCFSLLIFDLCERGIQLINPFYSIWVTPVGTNLALSFIILAGISAALYFIFLCYMIWTVFRNISIKRAVLPTMSQARRLHYEGIIYRFNFLMFVTVLCAGITILSFILSQVAEGHNKWDEDMNLEISSALHTGVYGMWNIYICAMLILYAPSHKQWPSDSICQEGEEVEFSRLPTESIPSEISSLTSFATKASIE